MPSMPPNPCRYPGCNGYQVDRSGFCEQHRKQAIREYDGRRDPAINAFYSSTRWRKLRALKLAKDPYCEKCLERHILTEATIVHHIDEVTPSNRPKWLDYSNLQSVCHSCHERTKDNGRRS